MSNKLKKAFEAGFQKEANTRFMKSLEGLARQSDILGKRHAKLRQMAKRGPDVVDDVHQRGAMDAFMQEQKVNNQLNNMLEQIGYSTRR